MNYETLKQFEATSTTLAYTYRELVYNAESVNRELQQLTKIVEMNATEFSKGQRPFYSTATATTATDFERALAKYEAVKGIFITACDEHDVENDLMVTLILQAQGGK